MRPQANANDLLRGRPSGAWQGWVVVVREQQKFTGQGRAETPGAEVTTEHPAPSGSQPECHRLGMEPRPQHWAPGRRQMVAAEMSQSEVTRAYLPSSQRKTTSSQMPARPQPSHGFVPFLVVMQ